MSDKTTDPLAEFDQSDADYLEKRIGELHCHAVLHEGELCSKLNRARISEVLRVTVGDVRRGVSEQIGKGRKLRRVLIPKSLASEIAAGPLAENAADRWPLFRRRAFDGRRFARRGGVGITARWACKTLHDWAGRAGLDSQAFHPHAFRHFFAKEALKSSGNDVSLVCDLLGHADIKTTSKYLKLTQAEQRQGLDRIANWF